MGMLLIVIQCADVTVASSPRDRSGGRCSTPLSQIGLFISILYSCLFSDIRRRSCDTISKKCYSSGLRAKNLQSLKYFAVYRYSLI